MTTLRPADCAFFLLREVRLALPVFDDRFHHDRLLHRDENCRHGAWARATPSRFVDNPLFISLCIHLIAGPVNRALVANATAADAGGRLTGIRCSDTVLALQRRCLLCVPLV